ncbi:hypothetical protein [Cellulomonas sp. FA1]|uniref:hypothetical protein n=1 Tax=Cellulomonas sp. FA1 TaxID=1346710 RepID=UPI000B1F5360|nr:hypothetical protein [Cellulomonas sp. FA1]
MRPRRRLAALLLAPAAALVLAACSDGEAPAPGPTSPVAPRAGAGASEPPSPDDQRAVLAQTGDATEAFAGAVAGGGTQRATLADVTAGSYAPRVVCTSDDGAPVTVTVVADGAEVASSEAPCVPLVEGGATMADGPSFDLPGGAVDVTVTAATDAVVAVGLVAAG